MASFTNQGIVERPSPSRPPFFDSTNFAYWKMRMESYLFSIDYYLWKIVRDGFVTSKTEENDWNEEDIKKHQIDHKAKYIIFCSILPSEYEKLSACSTSHEIWRKLEVVYEGTDQVKDTKINLLMSQYEEFKLLQNENISNMNGRFQKIINNLKMLGKIISEEDQIKKILRSLTLD